MATLTSDYQYLGRSSAISPQSGSYYYYILLYGKTSANQATGIHTVTIKEVLACTVNASFYQYSTAAKGTINGSTAFTVANEPNAAWEISEFSAGGVTYNKGTLIGEGSKTVDCTDGIAHNINLTCSWTFNSGGASYTPANGTSRTVSLTATLAAIPRASVLNSLTCSTNYLDGTFTYKYTPQNASYYNKLYIYLYHNGATTLLDTVNIGKKATSQQTATYSLSPADLSTIYAKVTNTATTNIRFTLRTYTDSGYNNQIGKDSTLNIGLSLPTNISPSASLTVNPVNSNPFISSKGIYVQGYSGLNATLSATPGTGATMKSSSINVYGYSSSSSSNLTIPTLTTWGNIPVSGTVVDSRGRTAGKTQLIPVQPYSRPSVSALEVERGVYSSNSWTSQENGADVKITFKLSISLASYNNLGAVVFKFNNVERAPTSGTTDNIRNSTETICYFSSVDNEVTYSLEVIPSDSVGSTGEAAAVVIPTVNVTMEFKANGKGVAFGKTSEEDGLETPWDFYFKGTEQKAIFFNNASKSNLQISLYKGAADSDVIIGLYDNTNNRLIWHYDIDGNFYIEVPAYLNGNKETT